MNDYQHLNRMLSCIENQLSYTFRQKETLALAFVHRSYINENKEGITEHNERLEFLGDSILGLITSEFLYLEFPKASEGELSILRSRLVGAPYCSQYLKYLHVDSYLLLGKGERMHGERGKESIFADLFEAIIGAIYLDGGYESAKKFFLSHFEPWIKISIETPSCNFKALLQDFSQKHYHQTPIYTVLDELGPDHQKQFEIAVYINHNQLGRGLGSSKKEAQQKAAEAALKKINLPINQDPHHGKS